MSVHEKATQKMFHEKLIIFFVVVCFSGNSLQKARFATNANETIQGKKPFHKKIQSYHFHQDPASEEEQVVQWELAEAALLELLDFKAISANYSLRHNLTGMIKKDKILLSFNNRPGSSSSSKGLSGLRALARMISSWKNTKTANKFRF